MGLIEQIKQDIEQITSSTSDFGVSITLTAPNNQSATITGLHTKIHLGVDTDGNLVNSRKAHISFSEKFLADVDYPIRNAAGEVDLKGHLVEVKDSTGVNKMYMIQQWFPDETIGLIPCILSDYEQN